MRPASAAGPRWRAYGLLPLVLAGMVCLVFAPAFDGELLNFDDDRNFVLNDRFPGLSREHLRWMFTTSWMGHYQPLSWLSANFDWLLGGGAGLDARPLHRTNVILHALVAVGVYLLALEVLRGQREKSDGRPVAVAFLAGALFALHPMRVESVVWLTERRDVLSGVFFVGCVLAWMRSAPRSVPARQHPRRALIAVAAAAAAIVLFLWSVDRSRPDALALGPLGAMGLVASGALTLIALVCSWRAAEHAPGERNAVAFTLAWACLCLSLLAKAWGIVLPALLVVVDLSCPRRAATWRLLLDKVGFAPPVVAAGALATWAQSSQVDTWKSLSEHGLGERLIQAAYGLAYYPWKTFIPAGLSPIHPLPDSIGLDQPRFLVPLVAVLLAAVALIVWRRRLAVPAWCAAAFAVVVAPVLGLVQSGPQLVADRYSYLSCIPFALLVAIGLAAVARRGRVLRMGAWAGAAVLVLTYAVQARSYAAVWTRSETLWAHALEQTPDSADACLGMSNVVLQQARTEPDPARKRALIEQGRALSARGFELDGSFRHLVNLAQAHSLLAEVDTADWRRHRADALEAAERAVRQVMQSERYEPRVRLEYGIHLFNFGEYARAADEFEWFASVRPLAVEGWLYLGHARAQLGETETARAAYRHVLELDPGHSAAAQRLEALR